MRLISACLPVLVAALVAGTGAAASGKIDGVYRLTWTEQQLLAAGANARYVRRNFGAAHGEPVVFTMTLRGGHFLGQFGGPPACLGSYSMSGGTVTIREQLHCQGVVIAGWSVRDGRLRLRVTRATDVGDEVLFGAKPWRRIG